MSQFTNPGMLLFLLSSVRSLFSISPLHFSHQVMQLDVNQNISVLYLWD